MSREQAHWEAVYTAKDSTAVSWYEDDPSLSLRLIGETGVPLDGAILDVGGGASKLGAQLFGQGYTDITVADISGAALEEARTAVADGAVAWVEADVREHAFGRSFDLWHDRAVFHFMTTPRDRDAYLATLRATLRPGGHLVIATFGPKGPTRCSGLSVARYGPDELATALGDTFRMISSGTKIHRTPSGTPQQFLYGRFIHEG